MIAEAYIDDDVIHVRLDGGGAFCRKYYYDYDIRQYPIPIFLLIREGAGGGR